VFSPSFRLKTSNYLVLGIVFCKSELQVQVFSAHVDDSSFSLATRTLKLPWVVLSLVRGFSHPEIM